MLVPVQLTTSFCEYVDVMENSTTNCVKFDSMNSIFCLFLKTFFLYFTFRFYELILSSTQSCFLVFTHRKKSEKKMLKLYLGESAGCLLYMRETNSKIEKFIHKFIEFWAVGEI